MCGHCEYDVGISHLSFFIDTTLYREFSKEKEKIDRTLLFRKERQEKREQQDYAAYKEWIELAGSYAYLFILRDLRSFNRSQ